MKMAEISGSVTIILKSIVLLFVAVYLDVTADAAVSGTELPEDATELQTTILVEEELSTSPTFSSSISISSSRGSTPRPLVSDQGEDSIEVKFRLLDHTLSDAIDEFEKDLLKQISSALEDLEHFNETELKAFRETQGGVLTARVEIRFAEKLSHDSKNEVYRFLLDLVEVQGEIGTFKVDELEVVNEHGDLDAYTYCNITKGCPTGANCFGTGTSCSVTCELNEEYCQNGGTCVDETNSISCICPEGITGDRCEIGGTILTDVARGAIIAAAVVVGVLILLLLLFCLVRKCQPCTKPSRELYGVENVVALHSIRDEARPVGGVAIQTDDSFLLNLSYANGVPPKAGYSHKIMQTNESFLLARSQNPKVAQVKAQAHLRQTQNGSPTESKPTPQSSTPRIQSEDSKANAESTQTGGSLPRKIIKV